MAAAAVISQPPMPAPSYEPEHNFDLIIQSQGTKRKHDDKPVSFDPKQHLAFEQPKSIVMMKDIGIAEDAGISPVAVSQPFRLFTQECVDRFREEALSDAVLKNCKYQSDIAACQLRGHAPKYSPFTYDAWKNPETLAIVSKIAGVDLIPVMDFEIANINVSVKSAKQASGERADIERETKSFAADEGIAGCPWEDDAPVVGWHNDSYPFVCVTMLSDCTDMVGGETALRTGSGDIMKVRGPDMGCAVVMQGRYISHQALRALGAQERITMVTSFRPRCPLVKDDAVLTTVRGISDLGTLYHEFAVYRLEMLEERVREQLRLMRSDTMKRADTRQLKGWLQEQISHLERTDDEIVWENEVVAGAIDYERNKKKVKAAP